VVRGLFVRPGFVVFGGLAMMLGCLIVMMGCFVVVLVDFWHWDLPVNRTLTLRRGEMKYDKSTSAGQGTFLPSAAIRFSLSELPSETCSATSNQAAAIRVRDLSRRCRPKPKCSSA